jgi:hypothetical protein
LQSAINNGIRQADGAILNRLDQINDRLVELVQSTNTLNETTSGLREELRNGTYQVTIQRLAT